MAAQIWGIPACLLLRRLWPKLLILASSEACKNKLNWHLSCDRVLFIRRWLLMTWTFVRPSHSQLWEQPRTSHYTKADVCSNKADESRDDRDAHSISQRSYLLPCQAQSPAAVAATSHTFGVDINSKEVFWCLLAMSNWFCWAEIPKIAEAPTDLPTFSTPMSHLAWTRTDFLAAKGFLPFVRFFTDGIRLHVGDVLPFLDGTPSY